MDTEKQCYGGKNKYCINVRLSPNLFQRFIHATSLREFINGSVQLVVFFSLLKDTESNGQNRSSCWPIYPENCA